MSATLRDLAADVRAVPDRTLLAFDFDGTLSPVVDDPAAATAAPGVAELLADLSRSYARVAVVSGRPVAFLAEQVPSGVALSGLYGLEERIDGQHRDHHAAHRWRPVVEAAVAEATARCAPGTPLEGTVVEPKGLSLTLHVRTRPDLADAVTDLAEHVAATRGLEVRPAKASVELHPPVSADKGTAVRSLADGLDGVCYVGDDVGDLPAFAAVAELASRDGWRLGASVAVGGPELPAALADVADLVLGDQSEVPNLLRELRPEQS